MRYNFKDEKNDGRFEFDREIEEKKRERSTTFIFRSEEIAL